MIKFNIPKIDPDFATAYGNASTPAPMMVLVKLIKHEKRDAEWEIKGLVGGQSGSVYSEYTDDNRCLRGSSSSS